jgi:fructokinase
MKPALMVGLGEVLWDLLPSGKLLGGAPSNFAYMTNVLGDQGVVASRVGHDQPGHELCATMQRLSLSTSYLQEDTHHETGTASVVVDSSGEPNFTIKESVAWDFLEWTPAWEELSAQADVVCFGTLAQRSSVSAHTIKRFLQNTRPNAVRICDINLRQSFYSSDLLRRCFHYADIVKCSNQEMFEASSQIGLEVAEEKVLAQRLLSEFDLQLVCVTRGAGGSLLVGRDNIFEHRGFDVNVLDAVGAGDAFTACVAHGYIRGRSLAEISEFANCLAAWVTTQTGATPEIDEERFEGIVNGDIF